MTRGEVYFADLNPTRGSEQSGTRPVVVVQADRLTRNLPTVVVVPLTSKTKRAGWPGCYLIRAGEGGLSQDSIALCHQVRVIDAKRLLRCWGTLAPATLAGLDRELAATLGL